MIGGGGYAGAAATVTYYILHMGVTCNIMQTYTLSPGKQVGGRMWPSKMKLLM